jgi:hypothetical protein
MIGTRRTVNEALVSIGALLLLLATLVAVDKDVHDQFMLRFGNGGAAYEAARAGGQIREMGWVLATAVRHQSVEHAPVTIFVVAAVVLTLFMLRT